MHVKYPVAFDMEFVPNDTARIDGLSREDRTNIAAPAAYADLYASVKISSGVRNYRCE